MDNMGEYSIQVSNTSLVSETSSLTHEGGAEQNEDEPTTHQENNEEQLPFPVRTW